MAVNWLMGYQQADPGQRFMQGFEMAQQRQRQEAADQEQAQFRQAQMANMDAQQAERAIEANRDRFIAGAQFLQGVTDEAGYQRAIGMARQAGIDLRDVPPTYDADYVRNVVDVGTRLAQMGQPQQQPTSFMRDAQAAGIAPGTPEFRQTFEQRYAPPPRIVTGPNNELLIVGGGGAASPPAPPELTDDDIQALDQGGAGQPGPRTFP